MKRAILGGALMICLSAAGAHEYDVKTLTIGHPWAPITHGNLATGVVYVTLVKDGDMLPLTLTLAKAGEIKIEAMVVDQ